MVKQLVLNNWSLERLGARPQLMVSERLIFLRLVLSIFEQQMEYLLIVIFILIFKATQEFID